jgi:hypothetical protein
VTTKHGKKVRRAGATRRGRREGASIAHQGNKGTGAELGGARLQLGHPGDDVWWRNAMTGKEAMARGALVLLLEMEKGTCEGENKRQLRSAWGSRSGGALTRERCCQASGGRTLCRGEKKSRGSGREEKRERGGEADGRDRPGVGPASRERRERVLTGGPAGFK